MVSCSSKCREILQGGQISKSQASFYQESDKHNYIISIVVLCMLLHCKLVISLKAAKNQYVICMTAWNVSKRVEELLSWLTFVFSDMIPITMITILNIALVRFLAQWRADHKRKFTTGESRCSLNVRGINPKTVLQINIVSICYIILVTPYTISAIILKVAIDSDDTGHLQMAVIMFRLSSTLFLTNYCINFFVCLASNERFRKVLKSKLLCKNMNTT